MAGDILTREVTITAGLDFAGTEFSVAARRIKDVLVPTEVHLKLGSESKTWRIEHHTAGGRVFVLHQSLVTATGLPGANTDTAVSRWEDDIKITLERDDQLQVVTVGASSEMYARIVYRVRAPSWRA